MDTILKKRLYGFTQDWADAKGPVLAGVFGELVKLAAPVVMHYVGDLWHDAMWLDKLQGPGRFYFSVREYGTSIGENFDLVRYSSQIMYTVEILTVDGEWFVTIEQWDEAS